jgi:2-haloalkanoic acid dehalogenase type II
LFRAIIFDLLTALLDSWTLWNSVAGSAGRGLAWRKAYLDLTYGAGAYRSYEALVREAAAAVGFPSSYADSLTRRWDELKPWPCVRETLVELHRKYKLAVVTNCSEALGARAAKIAGDFDVLVTAQRAGFYKPHPRPYEMALEELGIGPKQALFVAGSPYDIPGASAVGMQVYWHNQVGLPARADGLAVRDSRDFSALFEGL